MCLGPALWPAQGQVEEPLHQPAGVQSCPRHLECGTGSLWSPVHPQLQVLAPRWEGCVPPACCRSVLGASAGFYLLRLSCFPALFCGQGSLLLLCSSILSPHFIPGDEGCSSGSCSVPPLRFAGICGQQCWSRQKALLWTDRQMCCVHPEPSQGNMESRCWTGTCWRSAGPSLPPVPLWSGLESGALQGSGELGAALAALAERNVCLCGVRSVEKQPGVTLHRS